MFDPLKEFGTVTKSLFSPRPRTAEEISESLKAYNYKLVLCADVPIFKEKGWSAACYFGQMGEGVYVLMHDEGDL